MHGPDGEIEMVERDDALGRIIRWLHEQATVDDMASILSSFWDASDTGFLGGVCVRDGLVESLPYCNGVPVAESE